MTRTDAFYTIGKTHEVCQDYALAGGGVIALSDGCSSSPHTDIGARALVHVAVTWGLDIHPTAIASRASSALQALNLPEEALDATLLLAELSEDDPRTVVAEIAGDGVIVARARHGGYVAYQVEFASNAPLYLSYKLDADRQGTRLDTYRSLFGSTPQLIHRYDTAAEQDPHRASEAAPYQVDVLSQHRLVTRREFDAEDYDLILLMSDGATEFRNEAGEKLRLSRIIEGMLAVKTYAGRFIARRALRLLRELAAEGWYPADDFSVAALYLGPLDPAGAP